MAQTTNFGFPLVDSQSGDMGLSVLTVLLQGDGSADSPKCSLQKIDELLAARQVKPTKETFSIAAASWSDLADATPFTKKATVTAETTIGADTVVELINDNAVSFAAYGFAIGDVTGQVITLYAIAAPASAVSLEIAIGG